MGYFFEGALKFGIYEVVKPLFASFTHQAFGLSSKVLAFALAGGLSGVVASVVLCPMEALRIRLVSEPHFTESGWVSGGLLILEKEGVRGFMKGLR